MGRWCGRRGLADQVVDTVVLLTSEVVTNAIVHAGSDTTIRLMATSGGARVEVGDDSVDSPARVVADPEATSGRGLEIVTALATSWGITVGEGGKTVWFEVLPPLKSGATPAEHSGGTTSAREGTWTGSPG